MTSRIWQTWLPPDIARGAQAEEPRRFAALSSCVCLEVEAALHDEADPNRWHRLVKWLCYINTFNGLHQDYPSEHVVPLAQALWRAVAESWRDLEAQVRVAECLTKLLRSNKRTLRRAQLVLPWRPLFSVVQRLHGLPLPKLEGVGLIMARGTALVKLVSKARRHFEPSALGEVWAELRPTVLAVTRRPSEGYEALGYLQLFAPTHHICSCNWLAVNGWLREWFSAWDGVANSPSWDSLWLGLMSRAAKHDWRGILDWQPHLPHLFASLTGLFDVPIGSSRGAAEVLTRATPGRAAVLFGDQMGFGSFHAARLVVHLLKSTADPQRGPPTTAAAAAAASQLEHLTALLEQYYHPSNTGKWCRELGTLLKHLVKAAVKQLERQQPTQQQAGAATVGAAGAFDIDDYEFEYAQESAVAAKAPTVETAAAGVPARLWVSELREAELQRLAACCVTLAARGQFSKDQSISNVSIKALSQLSLVAPDRALPLVLERFRTAIATATATHQMVAATVTLALCVRPLLLAGWAAGGDGDDRETAAQLVSEALMAALPGLDANDEPKTNAVLHLYVSVISALPRLRGAGEDDDDDTAAREEEEEHTFARPAQHGGDVSTAAAAPMEVDGGSSRGIGGGGGGELTLSLYVAEWAEEVLERCLALLQNLDSGPGHRGTDMASRGGGSGTSTSSFLTDARSLFGAMWQLLLHHTRPAVRRHLVQRLAAFVLGGTAPGVAKEVAMIASQAASAAPREALRSLVLPLLARIEAEAEELRPTAETPAPSAGREATLRYHLIIMTESLNQLHADHLMAPSIHTQLGLPALGPPPPLPPQDGGSGGAAEAPGGLPPGSLMARVLVLVDRLLGVNSLVLQDRAATLGAVAVMALPRYWLDPHLPWSRATWGVPLVPGRGVELWVDKFGTGYQRPRWRSPSPDHVEAANQLLRLRLLGSAERLKAAVAAPGSGGSGGSDSGAKLRARAELLTIRALLLNSLSMLRDFQFGEGANSGDGSGGSGEGGDGGWPLAAFSTLGVTVGDPRVREQLAESMVEVCSALCASGDPELLSLATACGAALLAAGSVEYVSAQADEKHQRATAHLHSDPPAAARLMGPGAVWRRRSPQWVVQARLFNTLLSRASAAAFRSWATTSKPELTRLEQIPVAYLSLLRTLCLLAQHPNNQLARNAAAAVEVATKRFPCLAPFYLPYFLGAIAGVPYDWTPTAVLPLPPPPLTEFFTRVRDAAFGSTGSEAAAEALPPPPQLSETERDGKVLGSCHTISATLAFWRLISRSPSWLAAALAALLAARTHNASVPQKALGDLLLTFAGRFLHPPAMSYAGNADGDADGGGAGNIEYRELVRSLVEAARPGAMVRRGAPFRYTIIANAMLTLLLPHRYGPHPTLPLQPAAGTAGSRDFGDYGGVGGASPEVAGMLLRHMLELLVGADASQLRQLSMAGTFLPLCAVEEYGAPLPQLVDVLREAIGAGDAAGAVDGNGGGGAIRSGAVCGWGGRLLHTLIHSHTELDTAEAMKDKRGAGLLALQQRVLNMTFEEMAASLAALPLDRLARWPNDGLATPAAVTEGAFVVRHARLVQLLAAAAPAEMLASLRGPLEALTSPERVTAAGSGADKAEMATAAEVLAGLLASGAPWAPAAAAEAAASAARATAAGGGTESGGAAGAGGGGGWVLAALSRAIRGTSLDMADSWALSYRYAVRGLLDGLVPERLYPAAPPAPDRAPPPRPPLAAGLTPEALAAAVGDLLTVTIAPSPLGLPSLSPPTPPAAVSAGASAAAPPETDPAVATGGGGGGGGLPARIKRLRCVGAVVRELSALDPSRELPLQVRRFWSGLLDELHSAAASLDCLSLRDQLRAPINDALAYFGAADGLVQALCQQQQQPLGGGVGGGRGRARGVGCSGGGRANGGTVNDGSNGEGDLIHVSAEPSGVSTPAEVEVELGGGSSGEEDRAVLLMLPDRQQQHRYHDGLSYLRGRARSLALMLAARFNLAAVQIQGARAAEAAVVAAAAAAATTTASPCSLAATTTPYASTGGASARTDDLVLVDAGDVASVSASASETTSPGGVVAGPMEVDPATAASGGGSREGGTAASAAAVAHLGLGQEVLLDAAARHRSPGLRELVVGMLPGLLRLQDVAGPELQRFAREFQATLLVVRCLSLNVHSDAAIARTASSSAGTDAGATGGGGSGSGAVMLSAAVDALSAAAVVDVPWSARAAALSYAQTLWFRHAPLLSHEQLQRVQDVVAARLQDSKAEVRSLAAATLSGLLRGAAPEDVDTLRRRLLDKAASLFDANGRRRRVAAGRPAAAAAATTAASNPQQLQLEKFGCIAGLSALLMSYPYDVPAWLPPVLMALVRAAGGGERDGAVRGEAGRALGEFRRTHEAEAMEELRGQMDSDDWDSFTQATGTASYFV